MGTSASSRHREELKLGRREKHRDFLRQNDSFQMGAPNEERDRASLGRMLLLGKPGDTFLNEAS